MMFENMLFLFFLFGLTISMIILSTGLPWLSVKILSFVLMILTGSVIVIHVFPIGIEKILPTFEKVLLTFVHLNTIETFFVVLYAVVNIAVLVYYLCDKKKEFEDAKKDEVEN